VTCPALCKNNSGRSVHLAFSSNPIIIETKSRSMYLYLLQTLYWQLESFVIVQNFRESRGTLVHSELYPNLLEQNMEGKTKNHKNFQVIKIYKLKLEEYQFLRWMSWNMTTRTLWSKNGKGICRWFFELFLWWFLNSFVCKNLFQKYITSTEFENVSIIPPSNYRANKCNRHPSNNRNKYLNAPGGTEPTHTIHCKTI
jgi:hypothetical protein